jgi:hypothetical protein
MADSGLQNIVFQDADVKKAVEWSIWGMYVIPIFC